MTERISQMGKTPIDPNAKPHYGWVSIALHWIVAGLVIWLFFTGEDIEHATNRPDKLAAILAHNSIGVLLVFAALIRTFVRTAKGTAPRPKQFWLFDILGKLMPWVLMITTLTLVFTGVITWWTLDRPIIFFDLFEIPSPTGRHLVAHEVTEWVHKIASSIIMPLVVLHILGALKHLIINRDGVFSSIFKPTVTNAEKH